MEEDIIEIKIIGSNCSNGIKLKKELKRAVEKSQLDVEIFELNDENLRKKYRVKNIPALLIGEEIISEGKILTDRELGKLLVQYSFS